MINKKGVRKREKEEETGKKLRTKNTRSNSFLDEERQ